MQLFLDCYPSLRKNQRYSTAPCKTRDLRLHSYRSWDESADLARLFSFTSLLALFFFAFSVFFPSFEAVSGWRSPVVVTHPLLDMLGGGGAATTQIEAPSTDLKPLHENLTNHLPTV